jgi:hypothetical protein
MKDWKIRITSRNETTGGKRFNYTIPASSQYVALRRAIKRAENSKIRIWAIDVLN